MGVTLPLSTPAKKLLGTGFDSAKNFAGTPVFAWAVLQVRTPALPPVYLPAKDSRGIDRGAETRKRDEREASGKAEKARGDSKSHERHNRIVHYTVTECPIPAA
jgi:hypothetical protein